MTLTRDWKIDGVFLITGIGHVVVGQLHESHRPRLLARATVVVDGVETQQIEIGFAGILKFRSEAAQRVRAMSSFRTSEPVERNVGRDWQLRIEDQEEL